VHSQTGTNDRKWANAPGLLLRFLFLASSSIFIFFHCPLFWAAAIALLNTLRFHKMWRVSSGAASEGTSKLYCFSLFIYPSLLIFPSICQFFLHCFYLFFFVSLFLP